ncbi:hypothetical protein NLI96_g7273 [Meripilus lineatus]|uniref:Uncharacterized protein n=1 Tax=Meripilus lineatus TaxID=2056292 RepID=A0AAD5UZQ6_9APHY|nr:hypothetical protein NLI96_g7273 [Physisporinus lineatus]
MASEEMCEVERIYWLYSTTQENGLSIQSLSLRIRSHASLTPSDIINLPSKFSPWKNRYQIKPSLRMLLDAVVTSLQGLIDDMIALVPAHEPGRRDFRIDSTGDLLYTLQGAPHRVCLLRAYEDLRARIDRGAIFIERYYHLCKSKSTPPHSVSPQLRLPPFGGYPYPLRDDVKTILQPPPSQCRCCGSPCHWDEECPWYQVWVRKYGKESRRRTSGMEQDANSEAQVTYDQAYKALMIHATLSSYCEGVSLRQAFVSHVKLVALQVTIGAAFSVYCNGVTIRQGFASHVKLVALISREYESIRNPKSLSSFEMSQCGTPHTSESGKAYQSSPHVLILSFITVFGFCSGWNAIVLHSLRVTQPSAQLHIPCVKLLCCRKLDPALIGGYRRFWGYMESR